MPGGGVVRAPVEWLAEFADLPDGLAATELADALVRVGLEVERIETPGAAISGPLVVGRVLSFVDEPQSNGKTIRWCQLDVGPDELGVTEPRGVVCGAPNFAAGDLVVVALPGTVLPGPFPITARKTYGHISDGMICSARELGIGEDHSGILILPAGSADPGAPAAPLLGLGEAVLEIAVTPDRGYCLSIRGLAREAATALGVAYRDVAQSVSPPSVDGTAYEVVIEDPDGCDLFSVRSVTGLDPNAPSPAWLRRRLRAAGMRSISLTVDVTNYVMLETGQPLHAFDRASLAGPLVVRRARADETLLTLDGVKRELHPEDLLVADANGPLALAGVMGGASSEITASTTEVVLEAAHWNPSAIARAVRRHRLPSEAAKRFERIVDPEIAGVALERCVELLVEFGGAQPVAGYTVVGPGAPAVSIELAAGYPAELGGLPMPADRVVAHLRTVGCQVESLEDADRLLVRPPSWRPDLTDPADLVEEVIRLEGYDKLPSTLPTPPAGSGLTGSQQLRRAVSLALGAAGFTEVLAYPFIAPGVHDTFGLAADDPRRRAVRLANPLSDAEPELRTSLLPGLLTILSRNAGRGIRELALYEMGLVFLARDSAGPMPRPAVSHRPSDAELAAMDAALPAQPRHVAVVLAGDLERPGWWGGSRTASWADAVEAARVVARAARVELQVRRGDYAPWHPGRCAELVLGGQVIGYAGELHPGVVAALDLPPRTCAMELDLDAVPVPTPAPAPPISPFPPVLLDVALVVSRPVAAADVLASLRAGAGPLLESIRLFDVFTDDARLGVGNVSLAFALRFRATDRTLTVDEATVARDAAIARAAAEFGARLR